MYCRRTSEVHWKRKTSPEYGPRDFNRQHREWDKIPWAKVSHDAQERMSTKTQTLVHPRYDYGLPPVRGEWTAEKRVFNNNFNKYYFSICFVLFFIFFYLNKQFNFLYKQLRKHTCT